MPFDPFEIARIDPYGMPTKSNGIIGNWTRINDRDKVLLKAIGQRASNILVTFAGANPTKRIVPVHPMIAAMDVSIVHLARPLALQAFLDADELTFMGEYVQIAQHIDRARSTWPVNTRLHFYAQ